MLCTMLDILQISILFNLHSIWKEQILYISTFCSCKTLLHHLPKVLYYVEELECKSSPLWVLANMLYSKYMVEAILIIVMLT